MQIVGYDASNPTTNPPEPAVVYLADTAGSIELLELSPGTTLSYSLETRHCAGSIEEDGVHTRCENPAAPYCTQHETVWQCAICRGDCSKPLPACDEPHAIYLAAFAPDIFKVGVTREWRLVERLTEQGADRGVLLNTVSDGRIARQRERELSSTTDLIERVRADRKREGFAADVDESAWSSVVEQFSTHRQFTFDYGVSAQHEPLSDVLLHGDVQATKGRFILLDVDGTEYAVDMKNLLGWELQQAEPDTVHQSSFGTFAD